MVTKNKNNKNPGFSLAEALISMLIVSVFFVAATKIMTQKQSKESEKSPHGFFECYYKGGALYTHGLRGGTEVPEARSSNCNFQPPAILSFINVHYVYNNNYFNSQEPLFDNSVSIASPDSIKDFYPQCFPFNNACSAMFKPIAEFKNYLSGTHPESKIYQIWTYSTVPMPALFISW